MNPIPLPPLEGPFTAEGLPDAESRVKEDLDGLRRQLVRDHPSILAIVLVGSFGRGEGSVERLESGDFRALNDYDLFVVHRDPCAGAAVRRHVDRLALSLGFDHMDLELVTPEELPSLRNSMYNVDLRADHRLLAGDPALLDRLPDLGSLDRPRDEARTLLFNRLTCLLEKLGEGDLDSGVDPSRVDAVRYMTAKVVLAVSDARLTLRGRHVPWLRERVRLHEEEFPKDRQFLEVLRLALDIKLLGHRPDIDVASFWFQARSALLESLGEVLGRSAHVDWTRFGRDHQRSTLREHARRIKYRLFDPGAYREVRIHMLRRAIEVAEILLHASRRGPRDVDEGLLAECYRVLDRFQEAPSGGGGVLERWEAARRRVVELDLTYLHPTPQQPPPREP